MAAAALAVSVIAVSLSLVALWFTYRADRRGERELGLTERQHEREETESAERRRGRPLVTSRGGAGGPTANPIRHDYAVRNSGPATITFLQLWIVDGDARPVSTVAGGELVLAPNDPPAHMAVEVHQPLPAEQTLMVRWRDAEGEHEEPTGHRPPRHM